MESNITNNLNNLIQVIKDSPSIHTFHDLLITHASYGALEVE